jgi:hypothetical protein
VFRNCCDCPCCDVLVDDDLVHDVRVDGVVDATELEVCVVARGREGKVFKADKVVHKSEREERLGIKVYVEQIWGLQT